MAVVFDSVGLDHQSPPPGAVDRQDCGSLSHVARLVYIDETGSAGKGAKKQPLLTLAAVLVDEEKVQPLVKAFRQVAWDHLGWVPANFELHGYEIWSGVGHWKDKTYEERIAVFEQALSVLGDLEIAVAFSSIHKERLHERYSGRRDGSAYLLALQFLLEKIDMLQGLKILIADEAKEHELRAITMVADLQDWGGGEVPGHQLRTVIDSMHFVSSQASAGVQLADLVAFVLQRKWNGRDTHPGAVAAVQRWYTVIDDHALTWREPWPAERTRA